MKFAEKVVSGIFVKESNRRFICEVIINGKLEECFVPSSVKLKNYLKLENKRVILTENKHTNKRTRYSLYAVKYYNKYILLNLSIANELVEELLLNGIKCKKASLFREKLIEGYKTDLLILNEDTEIIEVKSVLSTRRITKFPNVYSERMIYQLKKILSLLEKNFKVSYYIVSLSPIVKRVILNSDYEEFYKLFIECINKGMVIKGFFLNYTKNEIYISPCLPVEFLI